MNGDRLKAAVAIAAVSLLVVACGTSSAGQASTAPAGSAAPAGAAAMAGSPSVPPAVAASPSATADAELPALTPVATIDGVDYPAGLVATPDAVWALDHSDANLMRIDPASNAITDTIRLGKGYANSLMLVDGMLWANLQDEARLVEVDPATKKVTGSVKAAGDGYWVVAGDGAIWALGPDRDLVHVDPKARKVVATYQADPGCGDALAVGGGWVWTGSNDGAVCRVDAKTGKVVAKGANLGAPGAAIFMDGAHLLTAAAGGGVDIVDPETLAVTASFPPPDPGTYQGGKVSFGSADSGLSFLPVADGYWIQNSAATIAHLVPADAAHPWTLYAGLPISVDGAGPLLDAFGSLWIGDSNAAPGAAGKGRILRVTPPQG